eukprot:9510708-Karenia_brevis.AAC.1
MGGAGRMSVDHELVKVCIATLDASEQEDFQMLGKEAEVAMLEQMFERQSTTRSAAGNYTPACICKLVP